MSVRKMLMVCFVAMVTILPLMGCNGSGAGGDAGGGTGGDSTNTTAQ